MCKDRTSTMKEIYQHFEQHFVEPFSFPNPAGAGSLGKSGPRLDSSTTGTFVMKRSYTETCAAYEAYAVAKPQCKMAKSTCLGSSPPADCCSTTAMASGLPVCAIPATGRSTYLWWNSCKGRTA